MEEPIVTTSNTERVDPRREMPKIENEEPSREKLRKASDDPR
jgi:hypothetical protein